VPGQMLRRGAALALLVLLEGASCATRQVLGHRDHSYKASESVPLYANKAGPFHNPRQVL